MSHSNKSEHHYAGLKSPKKFKTEPSLEGGLLKEGPFYGYRSSDLSPMDITFCGTYVKDRSCLCII
jgi:hypothetical protein